jgi:hypothetical protein
MNKRFFGRTIASLLTLTLCAGVLFGCKASDTEPQSEAEPTEQPALTAEPTAEPTEKPDATLPKVDLGEYRLEHNDSENYPYVVRTPHATWYLAAADIALLGEEAYFAGLKTILHNQEADFTDAIAVLDGYIKDEVPSIDIHTDFAAKTERAKWNKASAYYLGPETGIYLYYDWGTSGELLHEYAHYLTYACCTFDLTPGGGFWAEAIAEYVSKITCQNHMGRALNFGMSGEEQTYAEQRGLLDADGTINPKKYYCFMAALIRSGAAIGATYSAVSETLITLTEQLLEHPMLTTISYYEAGSFFNWLVERYGRDLVLQNMTIGQEGFKDVFGEDFETLFFEWAEDNNAWCEGNGIVLGPMEE